MRRFSLLRFEDETGVTGTGVVAKGVEWDDGKVAMRWIVGHFRSTVLFDNILDVEAIHGHQGRSFVIYDADDLATSTVYEE